MVKMLRIINSLSKTISILFSILIWGLLLLIEPTMLSAGPPYFTDDPEPVEYQHIEFYIASQSELTKDSKDITAPHFELNYGLVPNVQIHLLAPLSYISEENNSFKHYGYSDTEVGFKWRFIRETSIIPMLGIFPLAEIPTGNKDKGLGNGEIQYFLPLWLQKKFGQWSIYGGGGYWINHGEGNKNYWFFGWQIQYEFMEALNIGFEIFHKTQSEMEGESDTGFNIGSIINFSVNHHLLLSVGRDIKGPNTFTSYIAYQLTMGI